MTSSRKISKFLNDVYFTNVTLYARKYEYNINSLRNTFAGKSPVKSIVQKIKETDQNVFALLPENSKKCIESKNA